MVNRFWFPFNAVWRCTEASGTVRGRSRGIIPKLNSDLFEALFWHYAIFWHFPVSTGGLGIASLGINCLPFALSINLSYLLFHTTELVRVHYNGWSRCWSANRPVDPERQKSLKRSHGGKLHIHCESHMRWRSVNMVHSNVLQLQFFIVFQKSNIKTWYHRDWWETFRNISLIGYDISYPRVLAKLETGGDIEVASTRLMNTELQFVHGACRNFRYISQIALKSNLIIAASVSKVTMQLQHKLCEALSCWLRLSKFWDWVVRP